MKLRRWVGLLFAAIVLVAMMLAPPITPAAAIPEAIQETEFHEIVREKVTVMSKDTVLEWIPIRRVDSGPDYYVTMVTVDYALVVPAHGLEGDIEAVVEIYNPFGTAMAKGGINEMVVEVTRLAWNEIEFSVDDGRSWTFPQVNQDDKIYHGYMTFRVPIEGP